MIDMESAERNEEVSDVTVTIVVAGQGIQKTVGPQRRLRSIAYDILRESHNSGQPLSAWEMRDSAGRPLDLGTTVGELDLSTDEPVFLNLRAGVGG